MSNENVLILSLNDVVKIETLGQLRELLAQFKDTCPLKTPINVLYDNQDLNLEFVQHVDKHITGTNVFCSCGNELTSDEILYLGHTCSDCEHDQMQEIRIEELQNVRTKD